jgi:hypothetical protein
MNAKAKRRRAVPKTPRQESPGEAGVQEGTGAEGAEAALPAEGSVVLSEHLPESAFVRLSVPESERYLPCNPSIAKDESGGLSCLVRTVNYELGEEDGIWFRDDLAPNTRNYLISLGQDLSQQSAEWVNDLMVRSTRIPARDGLEDARLFWWRGGWWFTATALHHGPRVRGTMALCKLGGAHIDHLEFLHSPNSREMEKNWMPLVEGSKLSIVYGHHPVESYEIHPVRRRIWIGGFPPLTGWSGGSQLIPYDGAYLGVIHQRRKRKNRVYYAHRLVKYNSNLEPFHAGREFFFRGEQVEFCPGLVEHDGKLVLSFGVKDREAWLVSLTATQIASLLK